MLLGAKLEMLLEITFAVALPVAFCEFMTADLASAARWGALALTALILRIIGEL